MGVSGLSSYLKAYYQDCYEKTWNRKKGDEKSCFVFLDLNGVVHRGLRQSKATSPTQLCSHVIDSIRLKVLNLYPHDTVMFCLDGPGTRSKMILQRKRRNKNEYNEEIDTTAITPGTVYMSILKESLNNYIIGTVGQSSSPSTMILSASDRWGEGEFKIFEYINSNDFIQNNNIDQIISIVSDDSDVVLYSLLSKTKNIQVTPLDGRTALDIEKLKKSISSTTPQRNSDQVIIDFVFLSLLRGSDLLPKLTGYNFQPFWEIYTKIQGNKGLYDMETRTINWIMFDEIKKSIKSTTSDDTTTTTTTTTTIDLNQMTPSLAIRELIFQVSFGLDRGRKENMIKTLIEAEPNGDYYFHVDGVKYGPYIPRVDSIFKKNPSQDIALQILESNLFEEIIPSRFGNTTINLATLWNRKKSNLLLINSTDQKYYTSFLPDQYILSLLWLMDSYAGICTNFMHIYPFKNAPHVKHLDQSQMPTDLSPITQTNFPLKPLQFNLALTNSNNRRGINPIFHPLMDKLDHFSLIDHTNEMAWSDPNGIDKLKQCFDQHLDIEKLDIREKELLEFSPTLKFRRDEQKKRVVLQKELLPNSTSLSFNAHSYGQDKYYNIDPNQQQSNRSSSPTSPSYNNIKNIFKNNNRQTFGGLNNMLENQSIFKKQQRQQQPLQQQDIQNRNYWTNSTSITYHTIKPNGLLLKSILNKIKI